MTGNRFWNYRNKIDNIFLITKSWNILSNAEAAMNIKKQNANSLLTDLFDMPKGTLINSPMSLIFIYLSFLYFPESVKLQ